MKLPLVGIEDYIWAVTALHLTQEGTNLWPSIISGDPIENYVAPDGSMTLDLVDSNKTRFFLTIEGDSQIVEKLKDKKYVGFYSCFFHGTYGVNETIVEKKFSSPQAYAISFIVSGTISRDEEKFRIILQKEQ